VVIFVRLLNSNRWEKANQHEMRKHTEIDSDVMSPACLPASDAESGEKANTTTEASRIEVEGFDRFLKVMARVLGIRRSRLRKIFFQGQEARQLHRRSTLPRKRLSS
jgi:hypothetical protein